MTKWVHPALRRKRVVGEGTGSSRPGERVLVVRLDGIGDVVLTGPFLRELRRARPDAEITLVVSPPALNLVELCPYVDHTLTVSFPPATRWWSPLSRRRVTVSFARHHLRAGRFDLAIVPRWGVDRFESSALAFLSAAPERIGYSEHVSGEKQRVNRGYDRYFTSVLDDRSVVHEVSRNLRFLEALGLAPSNDRLDLWLSSEDEVWAEAALGAQRGEAIIALGPGAGSPKRIWPIDRYAEIGRWVMQRGGRLLVVGGPDDEARGATLRRVLGPDVIDMTGKATLRQTGALLRRSSFFCGNDAGPMHLAAAAGIPVVEVSCHPHGADELHPNSPSRFGPWGVPHRVVRPEEPRDGCARGCRARSAHCILGVPVGSVIDAVARLTEETRIVWRPADVI
jgi:heptosyltransferase-2